jgi:hypothetical protein
MPRLLASAKKSKKPLLGNTSGTRNKAGKKPKEWKPLGKTATYKWLNRLGFYATEEKKGVYVDGHEREDVIEYRQKVSYTFPFRKFLLTDLKGISTENCSLSIAYYELRGRRR